MSLLKIVTEREIADSESIDIKFAYLEVETWENRIVSLEGRAGSPSLRAANPRRIEDELMRSRTSENPIRTLLHVPTHNLPT